MQTTEHKPKNANDASNKKASAGDVFFQPKLTINEPGDEYEREADSMADHVMRMPINNQSFFKPTPVSISQLQRKCRDCEDEEKLHRKENSSQAAEANSEVSSYIGSLSSKGSSLPENTRNFFEPRFGQDFSDVKIHNDADAARSANDINALAYTTGNNIVFNQNQFSPESDDGRKLLAHELTHVVQQGGRNNKVFRKEKNACSSRYKNKATEEIDKKTFDNQLTGNIDSWTPYLINKIGAIINETFNKKEEIGWLGEIGHLVIETGKELLDVSGIEGEGVKAGLKIGAVFINFLIDVCGENSKISDEDSLESMKIKIADGTEKALVSYQDDKRKEGQKFIDNFFKGQMRTSKDNCAAAISDLTTEVDEKFPRVSVENYGEIKEIAEKLVRKVSTIETYLKKYRDTGDTPTEDRMKQFATCRRQYLPENGAPTPEQDDYANMKCYYLGGFPFEYEKEGDSIIEKIKHSPTSSQGND
jgi:hypothetical protein